MEVMAMENNDLKEKIRKNVKERIAVSNIREEFDMKITNKRKIIYGTLSACEMCVLCLGVALNTEKGNIPMAVLKYLTPKEKRAELEVFGMINCAI